MIACLGRQAEHDAVIHPQAIGKRLLVVIPALMHGASVVVIAASGDHNCA